MMKFVNILAHVKYAFAKLRYVLRYVLQRCDYNNTDNTARKHVILLLLLLISHVSQ